MKSILSIALVLVAASLASCGGGKTMSDSEMNKMADSIAAIEINNITTKAGDDCEARISTEVPAKVDSIVKTK